jgi:hypothetical protein
MFEKFKKFIKEYWYLIGAVILAGIVISYWFRQGVIFSPKPVEYPGGTYNDEINFSIDTVGNLDSPSPIYVVDLYSEDQFNEIIDPFDIEESVGNSADDMLVYSNDRGTIQYYTNTGIAYFDFESPQDIGININKEIDSSTVEDVVKQMHDQIFPDFPEFRILTSEITDYLYVELDYKIPDYNVYLSSFYLQGSSIQAQFTKFGKLKSMKVLLVSEFDFYQNMPLMAETDFLEIVNEGSFPKYVEYEINDSAYGDIHPVLLQNKQLTSVSLSDVSETWMFFTVDDEYAFPMYMYTGSGVVSIEDIDETFSADISVYVSPINPSFVTVPKDESDNEEDDNEENDLVDEIDRGEGDLFLGGEL